MLRKTMGMLFILTAIYLVNYSAVAEESFTQTMNFSGSRFSAGYLDSGSGGSYPAGSFQIPETRLEFNWLMDSDTTVYAKMNLNNAKFNGMCCFYIELENILTHVSPSLKGSVFNPTVDAGQFKADLGEEYNYNDPTDGILISNSAANICGMDKGVRLSQALPQEKLGLPFKWSIGLSNGNAMANGVDNNQAKAIMVKLATLPLSPLYASASYYNSGDLKTQDAALPYAALVTRPTNATEWTRSIWEFDLRYDIQPGKEDRLCPGPPAFSDSKAFFRAAYGKFDDSGKDKVLPILSVTDRKGSYYYVEGCYNATEKLYFAARYSAIGFDKSATFAALNGVNANKYTRISVGPGYRLSSNTHVKAEYSTNNEDTPAGTSDPKDNQVAILFTTLFD